MREEDVNVTSYAKITTVAFGLGNYEASGGGIYERKSERNPHMKLLSLPNTRLAENEQMLLLVENFDDDWCLQWGSRIMNMRGHVLVEAFAELDVLRFINEFQDLTYFQRKWSRVYTVSDIREHCFSQ